MTGVVSLGSVNVDRVIDTTQIDIDGLASRYAWFPARGEATRIEAVPAEIRTLPARTHLGGKGANQAVAASRADAAAALLGCVGDDHADHDVMGSLRAAEVDVTGVAVAPFPTGRAYVFVDDDGQNRIVTVAGANGRVDRAYVRERYSTVVGADVLLLQNELPIEPVRWLLGSLDEEPDRPTVIVDPAPAAGVESLLSYASVDIVTPNEAEYAAASAALDGFKGIVIRTQGSGPVLVDGPTRFSVDPPAVDVVDTTGAGDVFNGYLAAALAIDRPLREAVAAATVAASLSTRDEGARTAPTAAEVRRFRA